MTKKTPKDINRWMETANSIKVTKPAKPLPKKKVKKGK